MSSPVKQQGPLRRFGEMVRVDHPSTWLAEHVLTRAILNSCDDY